ncbi:MAG: hypothetical protein ABI851_10100 [Saprospiraceae bacterium]
MSLNKSISFMPLSKIFFTSDTKMYLEGKTNLGIYICDCQHPQVYIPLCFNFQNNKAIFQDIQMNISTTNIDCHNSLYNYNIKKGLNSEKFPFIKINLLEAWKKDHTTFINESDWFDTGAKLKLIIKEVQKTKNVSAKALRLSKNKYRIKGRETLSMRDFNIVLPPMLFGLIEVDDKVDFNYDLVFEIKD